MKVLLTGYKGFIGQNLYSKIKQLGWDCSVFDYEIFDGDVQESLTKLMLNNFDYIFHVGANSDTMDHDYNSMMYTNYLFSKLLFDLAGDARVIYSSSAATYGDNDGVPTNIYAWSKKAAEDYGLAKCKDFVALRYFNVYGPHEEHKGLMASMAYRAWRSEDASLFPKAPQRDFVYIEDVVEANIHATDRRLVKHGWYDVGTGNARLFESLMDGMKVKYTYLSEKAIPEGYQFYTKATQFMPEWSAKYSVEQGCEKYLDYLSSRSSIG